MTQITHEEWLENRKKGIGGSDVGCIFGLNKYKSNIQVWLEKTSQIEPEDLSDNFAVEAGILLEPLILKHFTRITGLAVSKPAQMYISSEYPFMIANVDAEGTDTEGKRFVVECKTANAFMSKDWTDDKIPPHYELQVLHYIIVNNYDYGYIVVSINNKEPIIKRIDITETDRKIIISKEKEFWECVQENKMPQVEYDSDSADKTLSEILYPVAVKGSVLQVTNPHIDELIIKRNDLNLSIKKCEEELDLIENEIKDFVKDNEKVQTEYHTITWRNQSTKRLDQSRLKTEQPDTYNQFLKTTESRVLRCK